MPEPYPILTTTAELVAAAAREGLRITPDTGELDTMGLDYLVVHGRDGDGVRWIVRSPRRADVRDNAAREARTLRAVAPVLAPSIAVPDWRIFAPDVIAYPRLEGTPAITLDTGAPVWNIIPEPPALPPETFLASLASLLAALQRTRAPELRTRTIPEERATVAEAIAAGRELLDPPAELVARWERWHANEAAWPAHTALSHGDLHPGHLLLDPDGRITGVLDWTEAAIGDPAIDLAMVLMCHGRPVLDDIAGRVGATALVPHAVERAAAFPALGARWAKRTDSVGLIDYLKAELPKAAAY
jgi:aminoglycoside phosphotransferase (APT) family kinase protein